MQTQYEEGEIITSKCEKLEEIDSESSLRSLSDTNGNERIKKPYLDEISSLDYVCPFYNFLGKCNESGCKKRHIYVSEGQDKLITENLPLLDQLVKNGERIKVPYENALSAYRASRHQIIKPKVIVNYTPELCEKYKRTLMHKLRKDIDKMQDKLKTIYYLKKWVMHNFVDASDFSELYYSLNPTQQIHFMNFFRVLELQPPSFQ